MRPPPNAPPPGHGGQASGQVVLEGDDGAKGTAAHRLAARIDWGHVDLAQLGDSR